jgi:hypothetical protein
MKSRYIISHSDLSMSGAESEPPCDAGAVRARSASIFYFFDFLHGAPVNADFRHRGFLDEVVRE